MALELVYFASRTVTDLVDAVNTFIAAQPLTLLVDQFNVVAHDKARYTGIEFRVQLAYDPTGAAAIAAPLYLEAFDYDQLPLLQQEVNAAIAASPGELWVPLPLVVQDSARLLDRNLTLFWRNADPAAAANIKGA